ncbi:MAG: hypothetical protein AUJ37_03670 [Candidatus Magasanikbacteria bacterium CG1_02_41_34]|uniref:Uncharacterized protein n=1 Tax=Candidatus Magasanikbacteria bacterium CG_4_10_14_0_2_um_filter_41_31 TaxID=1974639 RepID=A0A2M7V202_9BACT|nr:MAG: hypothetical protein AUJ37_03670 [Candidatus Magasanikbacteria bacterium CG1_02_41_34]PIZ92406.1 MAG: hypothetical protein COX83_04400 [Candidatus Magasanikbacteria bacterium CG_4_10_14_0_2_um_filter_41_31]
MKKLFNILFVTLGIIFFLLILAGVYLYVADPYGIKPLIQQLSGQATPMSPTPTSPTTPTEQKNTTASTNPLLSPTQEQTLEKLGIDTATLPTSITPAMEACFYTKLGITRADEIKHGATPTAGDYFAARSCL